jgi:hypothetical protein
MKSMAEGKEGDFQEMEQQVLNDFPPSSPGLFFHFVSPL